MKRFFRSLNFPRGMILVTLIGSIVLGYLVYVKSAELKQLQKDKRDVPFVVQSIQMKAKELDQLQKAASREGFSTQGQDDPLYYIRQRAQGEHIGIGQVDVDQTTTEPMKGVEDLVFKIRPKLRTSKFARGSIANFLYKLEQDSRRVKVTSIKLTPAEKLKPGEIGDNWWTFEAVLTSRRAPENGG